MDHNINGSSGDYTPCNILDDSLTQPFTQELSENSNNILFDKKRTLSVDGAAYDVIEEEEDCWGLLRRKGVDQECQLLHRVKDNRRDVYCIGRKDTCDIIIPDQKVSSVHCLIYCAYSEEDMLTMYVEDCSANGTFVNSSLIRLKHGERTVLKSGDEIFLMNPRFVKSPELVSFVFINMRERLFARKKVSMLQGGASASGPHPSAPPHRQLQPSFASAEYRRTSSYGSRIEDLYVIGEPIGSGMCGQVHVCTHKGTKTQWAVKIIDTKKFGKAPGAGLSVGELRQEAELMRLLHHPNIIRIEDTFETSNKIFIVMELVSGGDLFDRIIDRGKYPESRARLVMRMLLEAVKYLHDHNIVHRDLKPENILLVDDGLDTQVKLTDFGLAKRASREGLKTFCGTPQYFAPEVLDRKEGAGGGATAVLAPNGHGSSASRYGFKADMWSLGVVLYIMLSGSFPFDEENLYDQLRAANYSVSGAEWRDVSSHAKHFVRSLMTLNPADRLDVTQALDHPWMHPRERPGTAGRGGAGSQASADVTSPLPSSKPEHSRKQSTGPGCGHSEAQGGRAREGDIKEVVRTKTFSPVFWSNRPAFSATVSGSIPLQKGAVGLPTSTECLVAGKHTLSGTSSEDIIVQSAAAAALTVGERSCTDMGAKVSSSRAESPVMHAWYRPVQGTGTEGLDDIADFSSDDDGGRVVRGSAVEDEKPQGQSVGTRKRARARQSQQQETACATTGKKKQTTLKTVTGSGSGNSNPPRAFPFTSEEKLSAPSPPVNSSPAASSSGTTRRQSTSQYPIDLTNAKGGEGKKKTLRVAMKTLPEMFKLSSAKQDLQRGKEKHKPAR